jgi:hypothetical protein
MGAALAIGGQVLGWIWSHKALAALIAVSIYAWWLRGDNATLTIQRDAAQSQIAAAEQQTGIWKASYEGAASALKDVRQKLDSENLRAEQQKRIADQRVADLAAQRDAALSRAETFRTELMRKASEPGATAASVGRAALEGLR